MLGNRCRFSDGPVRGALGGDYHLFFLGALSLIAATVARAALQQRWRNWVRLHITGMGLSYILMLTAFYVDNGKNLPLWKELPQIAFWLLPAGLGIPLSSCIFVEQTSAPRTQLEAHTAAR